MMEPRTSHVLGKYWATELYPCPPFISCFEARSHKLPKLALDLLFPCLHLLDSWEHRPVSLPCRRSVSFALFKKYW